MPAPPDRRGGVHDTRVGPLWRAVTRQLLDGRDTAFLCQWVRGYTADAEGWYRRGVGFLDARRGPDPSRYHLQGLLAKTERPCAAYEASRAAGSPLAAELDPFAEPVPFAELVF